MRKAWFGYTYIRYCRTICKPVCSDIYDWGVTYAVYDVDELMQKLQKLDKDEAKRLLKEIEDFEIEMYRHANACSTYDCGVYRGRMRFEFNKSLLDRFGVKYEIRTCGCSKKCEELGEPRQPLEVIRDTLIKMYPELE